MARSGEDTRERLLNAAYGLFYKEGFSRVGVDAIAAAAGVTKRTLYNHFESKDALVGAVLEHQHQQALARIREWGKSSANTPADFLAAIFEALGGWMATPRWHGSGFTRLTMELADLPGHPARGAARVHKGAVEAWLVQELKQRGSPEPARLAQQVMLLLEGCQSMVLISGDPTYVEAAKEAALRLVEVQD